MMVPEAREAMTTDEAPTTCARPQKEALPLPRCPKFYHGTFQFEGYTLPAVVICSNSYLIDTRTSAWLLQRCLQRLRPTMLSKYCATSPRSHLGNIDMQLGQGKATGSTDCEYRGSKRYDSAHCRADDFS